MSYFEGLAQFKGWNLFYFILTPDEFEQLFDGLTYSIINTSERVDKDYKETAKQEFFEAYRAFFDNILIGQQLLNRQQRWNIEKPIHESIIANIDKINFTDIVDEKGNPIPYKRTERLEPVINIDPFYLFWSAEREKLSVIYSNEPGIIGLRLSYPKYVSLDNSNYIETLTYETVSIYETLVKRIKKISRKAKVQTPIKLFKPNFWVSTKAIEFINTNKYLQTMGIEIR